MTNLIEALEFVFVGVETLRVMEKMLVTIMFLKALFSLNLKTFALFDNG